MANNAWQRNEGKNPSGGLNAKGRAALNAEGRNIKPGVKGPANTPEKMRRKGSFLSRMFGPNAPGKMTDNKGEPTRRALSANAWGEAVPKNDSDRAKLYQKGQNLLAKYKNTKEGELKAFEAYSGMSKEAILRTLFKDWGSAADRLKYLKGLAPHEQGIFHPEQLKVMEWMNKDGILPGTARFGRQILNFTRSMYLGDPIGEVEQIKQLAGKNAKPLDYIKATGKRLGQQALDFNPLKNPLGALFTGSAIYNAATSPENRGEQLGNVVAGQLGSGLYNFGIPGIYLQEKLTNLGGQIGHKLDPQTTKTT